MCPFFLLL
ncbi:hypothetical protein F383_18278 [Gossypium arboreum]|uniref:Uncharacterized protein n=1 Tax=Gossypium arboreum TaxID=29729 RepID=A0A0B0NKR4_GOSAR|nr:hypothetical protein F383_18278 [Gossypium arboreum]